MPWALEWGIPWKKQALYTSQEGLAVPKCLTNFLNTVHVTVSKGTTELPILHCSLLPLNCIRTEAVKERTRQGRRSELGAVMKSSQSELFAMCISTQWRRISSEMFEKTKQSLTSWKHVSHLFHGSVDEVGESPGSRGGWFEPEVTGGLFPLLVPSPLQQPLLSCSSVFSVLLQQGSHQRQETSPCLGIMIIITANTPFGWLSASTIARNWLSSFVN